MDILKLKPYSLDQTADYTFGSITVTGNSNLGTLSKLVITDGTPGQVVVKNALGGLSWITPFSGSYTDLTNKPTLLQGATIHASTTPPANPTDNSLWWDSTVGSLKIYYNDGSSSQWVDASSSENTAPTASSVYSNQYMLTGTTTDSTETEIFIDGVPAARIPVAVNTLCAYTVDIVAKRTDVVGDVAMFTLKSAAKNVGGVVADVGNVYEVVVARTDANINVDVRANDTADAFCIYVTGVAGKSFTWRAVVSTVEV